MSEFDFHRKWRPIEDELDRKINEAKSKPRHEHIRLVECATRYAITSFAYKAFGFEKAKELSNDLVHFSFDDAISYYLFEKTGTTPDAVLSMPFHYQCLLLKDELLLKAKELITLDNRFLFSAHSHVIYRQTIRDIQGIKNDEISPHQY